MEEPRRFYWLIMGCGEDLNEELFPYQEEGAKWLSSKRFALLADEMRLGKTPQSIRACDLINAQTVLILCPAIARRNWMGEWPKFSKREPPLSINIIRDGKKFSRTNSGNVSSYDLTANDNVFTYLLSRKWDVLILDEVQYLKNRNSDRAYRVFQQIAKQCDRIWALTGTPTPNGWAEEMFPLLHAFGAIDYDYWSFMRRFSNYFEHPKFGLVIKGNKRVSEFREILKPIMLRRTKEEVWKDLPEIGYSEHILEANEVDISRYWPPEVDCLARLKKENEILEQVMALPDIDLIKALMPIQQKVNNLRRYVGLSKTQSFADLISDELRNKVYMKIVIFAIHRDVINDLAEKLIEFKPDCIYGGTPDKKRQQFIHDFQNNPDKSILILNINAAGVAIDLSSACEVAFLEASWVPGDNAQAVMRVHKVTQKNKIRVRFFGLENQVDYRLMRALKRKTKDITQLYEKKEGDIFGE